MKAADWINVVYFSLLLGLGWTRSLPRGKRVRITALGALGLSLVLLQLVISSGVRPLVAAVIRDWLPAPIMLVGYWQAGQFFTRANEKAQSALFRFDQRLFRFFPSRFGAGIRWASAYFEFAYLFCYPMVPLGVGALYLMGLRGHTGRFWAVVLPATYACYLVLPFVQVLPPWALEGPAPQGGRPFQSVNLWINRHFSVSVDTFPSAHVATAVATALTLLRFSSVVGLLFLWLAISIAIGCVVRRYHYALDVLLGAALALLVFLVNLRLGS